MTEKTPVFPPFLFRTLFYRAYYVYVLRDHNQQAIPQQQQRSRIICYVLGCTQYYLRKYQAQNCNFKKSPQAFRTVPQIAMAQNYKKNPCHIQLRQHNKAAMLRRLARYTEKMRYRGNGPMPKYQTAQKIRVEPGKPNKIPMRTQCKTRDFEEPNKATIK